MIELNKLYNLDCMEGMKEFPDKYFDLAIVDPPYGIGLDFLLMSDNNPTKHEIKNRLWATELFGGNCCSVGSGKGVRRYKL